VSALCPPSGLCVEASVPGLGASVACGEPSCEEPSVESVDDPEPEPEESEEPVPAELVSVPPEL